MSFTFILLVAAFVCFVAAVARVVVFSLDLVALGLALWVLSVLWGGRGLSPVLLLILLLGVLVVAVLQRR